MNEASDASYITHPRGGKVLERTVLFYARWLAVHERPHLKQIVRIASTVRL